MCTKNGKIYYVNLLAFINFCIVIQINKKLEQDKISEASLWHCHVNKNTYLASGHNKRATDFPHSAFLNINIDI